MLHVFFTLDSIYIDVIGLPVIKYVVDCIIVAMFI